MRDLQRQVTGDSGRLADYADPGKGPDLWRRNRSWYSRCEPRALHTALSLRAFSIDAGTATCPIKNACYYDSKANGYTRSSVQLYEILDLRSDQSEIQSERSQY